MAHDHHITVGPFCVDALAGPVHPLIEGGETLAAIRREIGILAPGPPDIGTDIADGHALECAVVDLYPGRVDLGNEAVTGGDDLGGRARPEQRTRDDPRDGVGRQPLSEGQRLTLPHLVEFGVAPTLEAALGVEHRARVTDEDEHLSPRRE